MSPDPTGLAYADPSDPQTLNLYAYVNNNPLSFVDPNGECSKPAAGENKFLSVLSCIGDGIKSAVSAVGSGIKEIGHGLAVGARAVGDVPQNTVGAYKEVTNTVVGLSNLSDRLITGGLNQDSYHATMSNQAQQNGAMLAGIGMLFVPGPEEAEGLTLMEKWGPGTFNSLPDSLAYHFDKHGAELGAENTLQYLRQADQFASRLQRSRIVRMSDGATKFIKNGRYLIKDAEGKIVSFGKQ